MSEDRVKGLQIMLRLVLEDARRQGVDLDALVERVHRKLIFSPITSDVGEHVLIAIEDAVDAMEHPAPEAV